MRMPIRGCGETVQRNYDQSQLQLAPLRLGAVMNALGLNVENLQWDGKRSKYLSLFGHGHCL